MELGAISMMLYGFREREYILDIFEEASGLRMNHAYIRPGGLAQDIPDSVVRKTREFLTYLPKKLKEYEDMLSGQPIWHERTKGVAVLDVTGCLALGITGPVLRAAGLGWDLRKTMPYLATRPTTSRSRPRPRPTCGAGTRSGWPRSASP